MRHECTAALVPEPDNPHDPNAVMVQIEGRLVGYLSRADAVAYAPLVQSLAARGRTAVCEAMVAGRGESSGTSNLGVFLRLPARPRVARAALTRDPLAAYRYARDPRARVRLPASSPMRCERGQASVEWVGLVLLASLALGALAAAAPAVDGRSFGGLHVPPHRVRGRRARLRAGERRARPRLRRSRRRAPAPPRAGDRLRAWRGVTAGGLAPLSRSRVLGRPRRPRPRRPSNPRRACRPRPSRAWCTREGAPICSTGSTTPTPTRRRWGRTGLGRRSPLRLLGPYPGFHADDWEGYAVRVDRDGRSSVRATSHGHWQWCKHAECHSRWGRSTGWTRVSRGSHAGHVPLGRRIGAARAADRREGADHGSVIANSSPGSTCASEPPRRRACGSCRSRGSIAAATGRWTADIDPPWLKPPTAIRRAAKS